MELRALACAAQMLFTAKGDRFEESVFFVSFSGVHKGDKSLKESDSCILHVYLSSSKHSQEESESIIY